MRFVCPTCEGHLRQAPNVHGFHWVCPTCHGRAVALPVLRAALGEPVSRRLWAEASSGRGIPGRPCPTCRKPMTEISPPRAGFPLDLCRRCQFVWFDTDEFVRSGGEIKAPVTARPPPMPARSAIKEAIAQHTAAQEQDLQRDEGPDEPWKLLPAIFELPVESRHHALQRIPLVTWMLAALCVVATAFMLTDPSRWITALGFIPAEPFRLGGLTYVTSFFLHAGILHLVGNLYFLVVFGDNVEDSLGPARFLGLIAASDLAGTACHMAFAINPNVPAVGASAGISGVIAYYALQFPHARLGLYLRYGVTPLRWISFSARTGGILWLVKQGYLAILEWNGETHIAASAHLGGAAAGFLLWHFQRRVPSPSGTDMNSPLPPAASTRS